ncbi:MAG: AAA family ATPase, partial [Candidatus Cryptobacteroides sp.]
MGICKKCGKENRTEAKYCRFCGEVLERQDSKKRLIGKDNILPTLEELDKKLKVAKILAQGGARIGLDCIILGDPGSGKHFIAQVIADKIVAAGVSKQATKEVDAADWSQFSSDFDKNIAAISDGILLITNAHKLLPTTKASEVNELDKLFARMRSSEVAPIVILCGHRNDLSEFLANNKDVYRLFEYEFRLEAFSINELNTLTASILHNRYHLGMEDGTEKKMMRHFAWCMRQTDMGHVNGHLAEKTAEDLAVVAAVKGSKSLCAEDIDDAKCFAPKTEGEILSELDQYVGLQSVKDELKAIIRNIKKKKENGVNGRLIRDHYIFVGNPGTGKTTFARKFGEVLNAIGALPTGQFVEVSGKDFIGQFIGDTEANVKKYVDKAMGGVLFIDEAYALAGSDRGGYGSDAVNTLLNIAENRKGDFVCIMAGYTKEMDEFIRINPGTPSRFNVTIEFPDYDARELEEIFRRMLSSNTENTVFTLDAKAEEMLPKVFDRMYLKRTETFGNAREVRNLFDLAVKRHNNRG